MSAFVPLAGYFAFIAPLLAWLILVVQSVSSILTGFLFLVLPFLLWRVCYIGKPPPLSGHSPRLTGGYVPEPSVHWIRVAEIVQAMPDTWAAELRKSEPFFFKSGAVPRFIELVLKQHLESNLGEKFNGVVVDFADENVLHLTITSDAEWTRVLGTPFPVKTAAPEYPGALSLKEKRRTADPDIYAIRIQSWCSRGIITINGLRIHRVELGADLYVRYVSITNSWINELVLESNEVVKKPQIRVESSRLRLLTLSPHCCSSITLRNTYVDRIVCPPAERGNPFDGSLVLSGMVAFSTASAAVDPVQLQYYRNLRSCLTERKSYYPAHIVRAAELRAERKDAIWLVRASSWLFDVTSDYGNNPHRPAAFILLWVTFNLLLVWMNALAVVNLNCGEVVYSGWLEALCGDSVRARAIGAFLLTFQPFIDPLSAFRGDKLVVASSFWLLLWLWFSNLGALGLLAITSVGVRRSMKD